MHYCRKFGPDGTDYAQPPQRNTHVEEFTGARMFTPRNGEIPGARFYTPSLETCPLHPPGLPQSLLVRRNGTGGGLPCSSHQFMRQEVPGNTPMEPSWQPLPVTLPLNDRVEQWRQTNVHAQELEAAETVQQNVLAGLQQQQHYEAQISSLRLAEQEANKERFKGFVEAFHDRMRAGGQLHALEAKQNAQCQEAQ